MYIDDIKQNNFLKIWQKWKKNLETNDKNI